MPNIGKVIFKYEDGSFSDVFTEKDVIKGVVKSGKRPITAYSSGHLNKLWLRRVVSPCLRVGRNIEIVDDVDNLIEESTMSEQEIEKEINDKKLTAPRLTPELIDSMVKKTQYHVFEGSCLTVCCLTLLNGFTVTGESACASPENFNEELGQKIAYANARDKIWPLEGYLLKERLYKGQK